MATNSQGVFDLTMALIDELNETGVSDTSDTAEYKHRTLEIINILQGELYLYSDTFEAPVDGKRSIAIPVINFEEPIVSLDDYICRTVLPYGLAAHLLMDENPAIASTCLQRYEELKRTLSQGMCAGSEEIVDVYGSHFPYTEFSYWR
jgi:hypothetical protein